MTDCRQIDRLVTPYVDGEIGPVDAGRVERHLQSCRSCRGRVLAEQGVRALMRARQDALASAVVPPDSLRARCAWMGRPLPTDVEQSSGQARRPGPGQAWHGPWGRLGLRSRLVPLALAASLSLVVGGAFLYELTAHSSHVMAAELAADHMKCFRVNDVLGTHHDAPAVESSMASGFGWPVQLPAHPERAGLELVGARPCLYGQGKIAHIMYRHNGKPVSVFMLPRSARDDELVEVLGHRAAIWSVGNRTFVLVTKEPRAELERMSSFVHATLR
jgi:anti-sigma factor RsiW